MENRATATTDALQQLNVNVNRTAIALDNAANSLTALQYSQFVESRCHDDDETQSNTTEVQQEACAMVINFYFAKGCSILFNSLLLMKDRHACSIILHPQKS